MNNTSDLYETSTIDFPVTALLFESDIEVAISNNYTVSNGRESAFGTFQGKWVSEAGISMPRNSHFVTIAFPYSDSTVSQKLVVDWSNYETGEHGRTEYDLIVSIVPPIT